MPNPNISVPAVAEFGVLRGTQQLHPGEPVRLVRLLSDCFRLPAGHVLQHDAGAAAGHRSLHAAVGGCGRCVTLGSLFDPGPQF